VRQLEAICGLAIVLGVISAYAGLLISYHVSVASGPAIILVAGALYLISLVFGRRGLVFARTTPARHRIA
jgi:zinc/manganese transport system permease protein